MRALRERWESAVSHRGRAAAGHPSRPLVAAAPSWLKRRGEGDGRSSPAARAAWRWQRLLLLGLLLLHVRGVLLLLPRTAATTVLLLPRRRTYPSTAAAAAAATAVLPPAPRAAAAVLVARLVRHALGLATAAAATGPLAVPLPLLPHSTVNRGVL